MTDLDLLVPNGLLGGVPKTLTDVAMSEAENGTPNTLLDTFNAYSSRVPAKETSDSDVMESEVEAGGFGGE